MNTFIESCHRRIFKQEMSSQMHQFIRHLSYLALSNFVAGIFLLSFTILAGRWIGPTEYGRYQLIVSLSNFFIIPMLLGMNTSVVKYLSSEKNAPSIVGTAAVSVIFFTILTSILFFIFRAPLQELFNIDELLLRYTIIFSASISLYYLARALLQGLQRMRQYALLETLMSVIIFGFFLLAFIFRNNFVVPTIATIAGYLFLAICVAWILRSYWGAFRFADFKKLSHYGLYAFLGSIAGFILGNIDRIMLNYFDGEASVGIYSAYFTASTFVIAQGVQIFVINFFPAASSATNRKEILRKVNILFWKFGFIIPVLSFIAIGLILYLFGKEYSYNPGVALLFAINTGVFTLYQTLMWLVNSEGIRGVRITVRMTLIIALANVVLNFLMIPQYHVMGAIGATIIANLIFVLYFEYYSYKIFTYERQST